METPQDPPPPQPPKVSWARYLIERRVPHIVAIYAGASWALVEFTAFATDEFLLSPQWTRMVLVTLVLMLPTVVMLAWFHGKPGRDRDYLARTEKVGIPANVVLCVVALWTLFGGEDLRSATTTGPWRPRAGSPSSGVVQARVPEIHGPPLVALGPGIGESESWGLLPRRRRCDLDGYRRLLCRPLPQL